MPAQCILMGPACTGSAKLEAVSPQQFAERRLVGLGRVGHRLAVAGYASASVLSLSSLPIYAPADIVGAAARARRAFAAVRPASRGSTRRLPAPATRSARNTRPAAAGRPSYRG